MMDPYFTDRLLWMVVGSAVGFVLGYIVRSLHDSKEEMDEVLDYVKEIKQKLDKAEVVVENVESRDEEGAIDSRYLGAIALFLVVLMTAFAAVASQGAANNVKQSTECNRRFLSRTISALNDRTQYNVEQTDKNVDLQRAQSMYLRQLLVRPPKPDPELRDALKEYVRALTDYIVVSGKTRRAFEDNPFPTEAELKQCLGE